MYPFRSQQDKKSNDESTRSINLETEKNSENPFLISTDEFKYHFRVYRKPSALWNMKPRLVKASLTIC